MHRSHSRAGGRNIPLSALGGGEGRGEVGDPRRSEQRRHPPHPPVAAAPGPSLSPTSGSMSERYGEYSNKIDATRTAALEIPVHRRAAMFAPPVAGLARS